MKNEKSAITSFLKTNAMQLLSCVMLALATYITLRLAPISQDLALVKQQVMAIDQIAKDRISKTEVEIWFNKFDTQLNSMDKKIDYLYQLHMR